MTGRGRGRPFRRVGRGRSGAPGWSQSGKFEKAHVIPANSAPQLVEWLTQPSASEPSPSSVSALSSLSSVCNPNSTTTNTTIAPPLESADLFSHTFPDITDAQPLLLSDQEEREVAAAPEWSEDITPISLRREGPAVASYSEICNASGGEGDDDVSMDVTWVPTGEEEEGSSEEEMEQQRRRRSKQNLQCTGGKNQSASVSGVNHPPCTVPSGATRTPAHGSAVWAFFHVSAADNSVAICSLCCQRISRGKPNSHLGTTALRRHMVSHHRAQWEKRCQNPQSHTPCAPLPASSPPLSSHLSSTSPSTVLSSRSSGIRQASVTQLFERKKMMTPDNPLAQRLTAGLSELLARQLLPYQLVDSEAFRKFVAIGTPQWKVPGRKYFSQNGIPDLYGHVQQQVKISLAHSVGAKIHLTTDTWSSKHGQGRYMTFTAHWVNLLKDIKHVNRGTRVDVLLPPRIACRPASSSPSSTPSCVSSAAESSFSTATTSSAAPPKLPRTYSTSQVRRCHAVLRMLCLEAKSHTGPALLSALRSQVDQWLTPLNLSVGKVVCDNGANLLSALKQGKITHVPCMAHVLNLVVQRFVAKYPGVQDVLRQARKMSGHFRRSYTAMARLADVQRRHHLPVRRLICDCPTRWNSTLYMLDRLLQQKRAINDYLYEHCSRTGSGELGFFSPRQWLLMRDACRLLRPFDEITKLVSRSQGTISDIVPYAFFLERALRRVIDQAVEEREQEDEEVLMLNDFPVGDSPSETIQQESEEESEEDGGWGEEEEVQEEPAVNLPRIPGVVRGWGEETEEDDILLADEPEPGLSTASNLVQMGAFMLQCFKRDPRIKSLKVKDLYWVATYLDPRYKHKVADMLPASQRAGRILHFQALLREMLHSSVAGTGRGVTTHTDTDAGTNRTAPAKRGRFEDVLVTLDMKSFFQPTHRQPSSGSSLRERLDRQVSDYIGLTADVDTLRSEEPLDYWVCRLDLWPELAQFAIELLACPSSSVLSERTFSAAGGIVTDKRTRLAHDSVDYLTFLKMNEAWISEEYKTS